MFKIGEVSEISGLSIQTIRFYESEGIFRPVEVDRWTNYRYYDESSIARLSEISKLKNLGFSLKEIKNLDKEAVSRKISETKKNIEKLTGNIEQLSSICKNEGGLFVKKFVSDKGVIGKWKKVGVVKEKQDFLLGKFEDENIFNFKEIYFLPNGEEYWVFSWTKGTLYVHGREFPYMIENGKMFVGIVDKQTNTVDNFAVYEKEHSKEYSKNEIKICDDTNLPFIDDKQVVGFWRCVDYVRSPSDFCPGKKFWKESLFLKEYIFKPNGEMLATFGEEEKVRKLAWTKSAIIDKTLSTVSEYTIKEIGEKSYAFIEWKSGDYTFGGEVRGYNVLEKY